MLERIYKAYGLIKESCGALDRQINIMEVCGEHTASMFRNSIRSTFPDNLKLLSGPGCPVCVTDQSYIETVLRLAGRNDLLLAVSGEMARVPASIGTLEAAATANVRIVASCRDALTLAKENPKRIVVFAAVGFETAAPEMAEVVTEAAEAGVDNFCVFCSYKRIIPAMEALLTSEKIKIDAFLCPGQTSEIIGSCAYEPIVKNFKRPCVVTSFEPVHIIEGLAEICRQLADGAAELVSLYETAITTEGDKLAKRRITDCFDVVDDSWRGLGDIAGSGLKLKKQFSRFDAAERLSIETAVVEDNTDCRCSEVICGLIEPPQCELFAEQCRLDSPVGSCMASGEGTCATWFKYGRKRKRS